VDPSGERPFPFVDRRGDTGRPEQRMMIESSGERQVSHRIETSGRWIGPAERPLLSWVTVPVGCLGAVGVVVVPTVGYEYWTSHRTMRTLAERLGAQGCVALRFDFDGTGDSPGAAGSAMPPPPCASGVSLPSSSSACASAARWPCSKATR
jgi:hypothetical protein